jgi:hypothetical protein
VDPPEQETPSPEPTLTGGLREGVEEHGLEARLLRYGRGKRRAGEIVAHLRSIEATQPGPIVPLSMTSTPDRLARQMTECGSWLLFRDYFTHQKLRLHRAFFCKRHLLCPFCAMRRGAKFVKAYSERLQAIEQMAPGLRQFMVTVTVKNGPDLAERFRHLKSHWQQLQQRRRDVLKGKRVGFSPFDTIEAAVWSFEVTNKGNGWHPHLHAVCLSRGEPPEREFRAAWEQLTGDSFMVDVRPIETADGSVGAFCEVFKYALKFSELNPEQNLEAWRVLQRHRLVGSLGLFRGIDVREWLTDDPDADLELAPYVERFFRFYGERYEEREPPTWATLPPKSPDAQDSATAL